MSALDQIRGLAVRTFVRASALTGGRLSQAARRVLSEDRFAALGGTGREGFRDATGALPVSAGRLAPTTSGRVAPMDLVVVTGASRVPLTRLVARTSAAMEDGGRVRPVFVIDSGDLAVFRTAGFVVDHLLDRATLTSLRPDMNHDLYVEQRAASLKALYGARRVLRADLGGATDDPKLLDDLIEVLLAP